MTPNSPVFQGNGHLKPYLHCLSYTAASPEALEQIASTWAPLIEQRPLLLLSGLLGSGKTSFVKALVATLQVASAEAVTSPTFALLNIYGKEGKRQLYHFDLYRLATEQEFYLQGFDEYLLAGPLCCIEWPERVASLASLPHCHLQIVHRPQGGRELLLSF